MNRAHKIQLVSNKRSIEYFNKACGTARFVFNWALSEWSEQYKQGGKSNGFELKRYFNSFKKEEFPWVYDVTKCASEGAFSNLQRAFTNFFDGRAKYPKYKKKFKKDSFYLSNDQFSIKGKYIYIAKFGYVKLTEELRYDGKILGAVVSRKADKWFVSINVEIEPILQKCNSENQAVGIDLGIKSFAVLSDGTIVDNPRITKRFEGKLRRLNKSLSRKIKGSNNWKKAKLKLARLHKKIANCRLDFIHKFTITVCRKYGIICLEDLNISGMLCNHKLAKHIQDISLYEVRRQFEYKANEVRFVNRFDATSKTCHKCDWKNDNLTLNDRIFICKSCGHVEDRDLNASKNIVRWATPKHKSCGQKRSGLKHKVSSETILNEAGSIYGHQ
jgi:putative transposase